MTASRNRKAPKISTFEHQRRARSVVLSVLLPAGLACSPANSSSEDGTGSGGAGSGAGGSSSGGAVGAGGGATGGASAGGAAAGGATGSGGSGDSGTGGSLVAGEVDAVEMAADMGVGTNIGNTLENTTEWETGWGQPPISKTFIDGIASRGIKTVRIPVAWDTYAIDETIEPAKMNRVKEVVRWVEEAGMYAIVNIHWDGGWIFGEGTDDEYRLTDAVKTKFASYWQQIATAFSDVGHDLVLEGLNEEGKFYVNGDSEGQPDYSALNELNQLFVTTVRAQSGYNTTRALLIAGFATDIELTSVGAFQVPADPAGPGKLFLSLHYYTPYTFSLMDTVESWGSPRTTWGTPTDRAELNQLFDMAAEFGTSRGIPIILGEFAVTVGSAYPREPESRIDWMTSVAAGALDRGMVPVLWDTGSEISRTDGAFSPEFGQVMESLTAN